jgi:hypothetical protein
MLSCFRDCTGNQEQIDIPLCLDSPNPSYRSCFESSGANVLLILLTAKRSIGPSSYSKEYGAAIIALAMDEGITHPEKDYHCRKNSDRLSEQGSAKRM